MKDRQALHHQIRNGGSGGGEFAQTSQTSALSQRCVSKIVAMLRHISQQSPPFTIFLVAGITVSDLSTPTNILLSNVSLDTGGQYKCEVSGGPLR